MRSTRSKRAVAADAARRAMQAWTHRVNGSTWGEVAEIVGYHDAATALRAVKNYFATLPEPNAPELRGLWRGRLEALWWQAAIDVAEQRPGALRAGVAIAQRAAALDGLDAPTRLELTDPTGQEFARMLALVAQASGVNAPIEADPLELEAQGDDDELLEGDWGEPVDDEEDSDEH